MVNVDEREFSLRKLAHRDLVHRLRTIIFQKQLVRHYVHRVGGNRLTDSLFFGESNPGRHCRTREHDHFSAAYHCSLSTLRAFSCSTMLLAVREPPALLHRVTVPLPVER